MALTTTEEDVLREIISSYQNGKMLMQLPDVEEVDPTDLYTEVVGSDGESRKINLANMLGYDEEVLAYGIRRSVSNSSPSCERIGNMDYHRSLPVQSQMRGCLLDATGNVVEYLPDNDWSGATLDGTKGDVMVEFPHHYRKCQLLDDGTMEVWLSLYPLPGYQEVSKKYVGAYEATVQRSTNSLCSVMNLDADYRGGNNNADWDEEERSLLGKPATYLSASNMLNYARNKGTAGLNGYGWCSYLYQAHRDMFWLFVVEYATLNSQATYNSELTDEGYHQGGLGSGVTILSGTSWSDWNSYYPFIPCGYTNSLGNHTGIVAFDMPEGYGTALTVNVPRYRGVENPFGHIFKWCCDVIVIAHANTESGGDGLNACYLCKNPANFNFSDVTNYAFLGNQVGSETGGAWKYSTMIIFGKDGEIFGIDEGGSSSTYYCDGNYVNNNITANANRVVALGGYAGDGSYAGLACVRTYYSSSYAYAPYGSRLCFLPEEVKVAA